MAQPQTVTGSFDYIAEAQQAVQLLLSSGFTADRVDFSTQTTVADDENTALTVEERSTGRFLTSIFGNSDGAGSPNSGQEGADPDNTTLVTVQVRSAHEVDQAVDSLKGARVVNVSKLGAE
ncbi:MAG: hypothetical protein H7Z72_18745 [Bacteroidetes bacterium]|nr:hypothetical protein [Fibrella sp.]